MPPPRKLANGPSDVALMYWLYTCVLPCCRMLYRKSTATVSGARKVQQPPTLPVRPHSTFSNFGARVLVLPVLDQGRRQRATIAILWHRSFLSLPTRSKIKGGKLSDRTKKVTCLLAEKKQHIHKDKNKNKNRTLNGTYCRFNKIETTVTMI